MTQIATSYQIGAETEDIAESDNEAIDDKLQSIQMLEFKIKENSALKHHTPKLTRFVNSKHRHEIFVLESDIEKIKNTRITSVDIEASRKRGRTVMSLCDIS